MNEIITCDLCFAACPTKDDIREYQRLKVEWNEECATLQVSCLRHECFGYEFRLAAGTAAGTGPSMAR